MPPDDLSTSLSTRVSTSPIGAVYLVDTCSSNPGVNVNESVHHVAVHQLGTTPSGHGSGHPKPAKNRRFTPLSTIFLSKFKKRRIGEENRAGEGIRARGWTVDRGLFL